MLGWRVADEARELIAQGIDLDVQDQDQWTALIHAANIGRTDTARELIQAGAASILESSGQ